MIDFLTGLFVLGPNRQCHSRLRGHNRIHHRSCHWSDQHWIFGCFQRRDLAQCHKPLLILYHCRGLPALSALYWRNPLKKPR